MPVVKVLVKGAVWCWNWALTKTVGSRLGMAEPANWTLRPLSTPPVVPVLLVAVPVEPSEFAPDRMPSEADDGPERCV